MIVCLFEIIFSPHFNSFPPILFLLYIILKFNIFFLLFCLAFFVKWETGDGDECMCTQLKYFIEYFLSTETDNENKYWC